MKYRFKLHAFSTMSNHVHDAITDVSKSSHSDLPNIKRDFHSLVARALNKVRGRSESLWSVGESETYNFVSSPRLDDIRERMIYTAVNCVGAGLVRTHKEWPGLVLLPGATGRRVYRFRRPGVFFSEAMPEYVDVVVEAPECEDPVAFVRGLMRDIGTRERDIQKQYSREGRSFLGAKGSFGSARRIVLTHGKNREA